jgi:3,4-dihydroxy-9,10-secoandrosta-1,3,5(10)-triene-9,17-dione 4,5-dioxygenase
MSMGEVSSLGYVVVSGADLQAWSEFGQQALGLQVSKPASKTDRDTLFLRMDDRNWRLAIEEGTDGDLLALGFEVADDASLDRLTERLETAGFPTKDNPDLSAQRGVTRLVQATDPTGVGLEFFHGTAMASTPFESPTGAHFVTGGQGIGHAVMGVNDLKESNAFYLDLLGFRLSDVISIADVFELYFTSPSPRHHSLAYAAAPPGTPSGRLQHIMLEVDDINVVGRALDHCLDHGVPLRTLLGRHTNDHMISFYCDSPSGLTIEYGFGGRQIDNATHEIGRYDSASFWGHRPPDGRNMEEEIRKMAEAAAASDAS